MIIPDDRFHLFTRCLLKPHIGQIDIIEILKFNWMVSKQTRTQSLQQFLRPLTGIKALEALECGIATVSKVIASNEEINLLNQTVIKRTEEK